MRPITVTLSSAFLSASAGTQPLDLAGNDQRLEVMIPPGAFDFSQATLPNGIPVAPSSAAPTITCPPAHRRHCSQPAQPPAVQGTFTLSLTEIHGHFAAMTNMLGEYQVRILDAGQPLSGVKLRQPITFIYHYQRWELDALDLDPGHLIMSWPDQLVSELRLGPGRDRCA